MVKTFPITIGEIRFHPESFSSHDVLTALRGLAKLEYSLQCSGPANSYQLNSTFDAALKSHLVAAGGQEFGFKPTCRVAIDCDFALAFGQAKVVFEIEKANKEKLLYDFLKMHVYLDAEISAAVLIAPVNWAHTRGAVDLFSVAQQRFDLCRAHGMADASKVTRMLIVGIMQHYDGRPLTDQTLRSMKLACKEFFARDEPI
jgi:hypothetical protein